MPNRVHPLDSARSRLRPAFRGLRGASPTGVALVRTATTARSCPVTPGRPPRVLVDATSVPADRGGVGRYVDGLLGALGKVTGTDVDLAVVAQRTDVERYARML